MITVPVACVPPAGAGPSFFQSRDGNSRALDRWSVDLPGEERLITRTSPTAVLGPVWKVRQNVPVRWRAPRDALTESRVLTRYADVMAVSKVSGRFTSTKGNMPGMLRTDVSATKPTGPVQRPEPPINTGVSSPPVALMRSAD